MKRGFNEKHLQARLCLIIMKNKKKILLIAIPVAILLVGWIIWGNTALMVSELAIQNEKIPDSFDGFRIAQISDVPGKCLFLWYSRR